MLNNKERAKIKEIRQKARNREEITHQDAKDVFEIVKKTFKEAFGVE